MIGFFSRVKFSHTPLWVSILQYQVGQFCLDFSNPPSSLEYLAALSATSIGRAILIRVDTILRLITSLPLTQHFIGSIYYWAEFCIANLHIPDEAGKFEEYLDQEITEKEITLIQSDDWLFFKSQVQPYSPLGEYPSA
jgi:hypothetical protein